MQPLSLTFLKVAHERPFSLRFVFPYSLISLVAQSQTVVPTHMACPDICQSPHSGARYRPYRSPRLYRRPTPSLRQHVVTSICQGAYIFICLHGPYLLDRSQVWAALAKAVGARPRRTYSGSVCVCVCVCVAKWTYMKIQKYIKNLKNM